MGRWSRDQPIVGPVVGFTTRMETEISLADWTLQKTSSASVPPVRGADCGPPSQPTPSTSSSVSQRTPPTSPSPASTAGGRERRRHPAEGNPAGAGEHLEY